MKASELRSQQIGELSEKVLQLKKKFFTTALERYQGKEKNIKKMKMLRKDLARILTVLNEKKFLSQGSQK